MANHNEPDDDHFKCHHCRKVFPVVVKDEINYTLDCDHNIICLNCAGEK